MKKVQESNTILMLACVIMLFVKVDGMFIMERCAQVRNLKSTVSPRYSHAVAKGIFKNSHGSFKSESFQNHQF